MDQRESQFEALVARCPNATRELVRFMRAIALNAGEQVGPPTFELRGVGVTYWRSSRRFCRFDPKPKAAHVGVFIPGGNRKALEKAGLVSDRDDGVWVSVSEMRGAVRLVPEILRAYDGIRRK